LGAFLSLINEGYIFIRGSTWISWDKVSGQTREGLWMSSDVLLMGGFRRVQMGGLGTFLSLINEGYIFIRG
jgi:hypothetical protein